jgi:hypothetical protein
MAYIDKELFKQDIKMRYCNNCARPNEIKCRACHIDDMLGEIEDAPAADVVEVVRCRDCKFAYKNRFLGEYHCEKTNCKIKAHHFCGQGIRK